MGASTLPLTVGIRPPHGLFEGGATSLRNGIAEDVVVIGNTDHLIVWNGEKIQQRMAETPLTNDDWKELELHGV